jgi:hypothetical protein
MSWSHHKKTLFILSVYTIVSIIIFIALWFYYLKSQVYDAGYQAAITDIADTSLTSEWCRDGVVLGLWDDKFTYVKNLQCPVDDITSLPTDIQWEDDFILPHLLDPLD